MTKKQSLDGLSRRMPPFTLLRRQRQEWLRAKECKEKKWWNQIQFSVWTLHDILACLGDVTRDVLGCVVVQKRWSVPSSLQTKPFACYSDCLFANGFHSLWRLEGKRVIQRCFSLVLSFRRREEDGFQKQMLRSECQASIIVKSVWVERKWCHILYWWRQTRDQESCLEISRVCVFSPTSWVTFILEFLESHRQTPFPHTHTHTDFKLLDASCCSHDVKTWGWRRKTGRLWLISSSKKEKLASIAILAL